MSDATSRIAAILTSPSDVWEGGFHEIIVNCALLERGQQIWLTPGATIYQERGRLGWVEAFRSALCGPFIRLHARESGATPERLLYAAFCLALQLLLAARTVRIAWGRGSFWSRCQPVLPILL